MLRGKVLPEGIYAHCLGASANPRITITTHFDKEGNVVWYVGGQPAEEGVTKSDAAQIKDTKNELQMPIPWLDFDECEWSTLDINRAEIKMADGTRPSESYGLLDNSVITPWPTKMALAPALADKVETLVKDITPDVNRDFPSWESPEISLLPWQEEKNWN